MFLFALTNFFAVVTKKTALPRKMILFHMLVWQLVLVLIPDIRQLLGACLLYTSTTFVGQNVGAGEMKRCRRTLFLSLIHIFGVSKANSMVNIELLEHCIREELNNTAARRIAVLKPIKVIIDNYPEDKVEYFDMPNNPNDPEAGTRKVPFTRELYICLLYTSRTYRGSSSFPLPLF